MMNPNALRKMQEQMQKQMAKIQEELGNDQIEATAGGGAVAVSMNGHQQVLTVKIDPEAVDPEDITMLEDMLVAAFNEAVQKSHDLAQKRMSALTGGLKIPGLG